MFPLEDSGAKKNLERPVKIFSEDLFNFLDNNY